MHFVPMLSTGDPKVGLAFMGNQSGYRTHRALCIPIISYCKVVPSCVAMPLLCCAAKMRAHVTLPYHSTIDEAMS